MNPDDPNRRYKRYIDLGDEAIPERTERRFRSGENVGGVEQPERACDQRPREDNPQPHHPSMDLGVNEIMIPEQIIPNDVLESLQDNNGDQGALNRPEEVSNYLRNIVLDGDHNYNINRQRKAQNIYEFIRDSKSSESITTPVDKNRAEILLMLLKYSLAEKSTMTGIVNLFNLVNSLFPEPILPDSKYLIDKLFEGSCGKPEFHAICHNCSVYLGKYGEIESNTTNCHKCGTPVSLFKPSSPSFFMIIDPSDQIADILKIYGEYYDWVVRVRVSQNGVLEDIPDGLEYIDFQLSLPEDRRYCYVSGTLGTDGADKFDSSLCTVWPLLYQMNELPPQARMRHLVTCGLYVGKKKPEMVAFLEPFVEKMNSLTANGIPCKIKGEDRIIYPYVNNSCEDTPARAPVQGVTYHTGYSACNWCEHPGVHAEGAVRFPYEGFDPPAREEDSFIQKAFQATPGHPVDGIVYPSPVINLEKFKPVKGFITEYMHQALEGNGKRIAEIFFDSLSDEQIAELDVIMENISVPCQLTRFTRKISERRLWKAREWENFILYYSIPLFFQVLSRKHFQHWLLFSGSLYIVLQNRIEQDELNEANQNIHEFVKNTEIYFGIKEATSNMHGFLHLCQNVARWGPAWGISAFSFESQNRYVLQAIKCAQGATQQMARSLLMKHVALVLEDHVYPEGNELIKFYCSDVLSARTQHALKVSDRTYLGYSKEYVASAVTENLGLSDTSTQIFSRMVKDGCLYSSRNNARSNDSVVQLRDKSIIKVIDFIVDEENNLEFTLYQTVRSRSFCGRKYSKFHIVTAVMDEVKVVATNEIDRICVFFEAYGSEYVCPVPNLLHY
ncbi:hypothetical protein QAD02_016333 [Eretmocerus hayati]|uniref:Uncharacterized protein n=1 Tax=Eretmocerus hayati TaxID=131215 RepID=A0ACC2PCK8_9HYME|nr:hypothetical protein QAD02_016333 [Eretmocerus hayati]